MSYQTKKLVCLTVVVIFGFVNNSQENEIRSQDMIVQSKAAKLIRRILSSEILSPDRRSSLLFSNTLREPKIKEISHTGDRYKQPVNIEKMLVKGSPDLLLNETSLQHKGVFSNKVPL